MKKRQLKEDIAKGSITVEASFIVPLTLLIIFVILSLCFYVHNRAWYTAAAGETVVTAGTKAVRKGEDFNRVIHDKIAVFQVRSGFPDRCAGMVNDSSDAVIQISADSDTALFMGNGILYMKVKERMKVIRPVVFIRKIQALDIIKE